MSEDGQPIPRGPKHHVCNDCERAPEGEGQTHVERRWPEHLAALLDHWEEMDNAPDLFWFLRAAIEADRRAPADMGDLAEQFERGFKAGEKSAHEGWERRWIVEDCDDGVGVMYDTKAEAIEGRDEMNEPFEDEPCVIREALVRRADSEEGRET